MEVFLFFLSFVAGGVVLTVAYIYHLTTKTKQDQDRLVSYQQNLQGIQSEQFSTFKADLQSVYTELSGIREEMKNDGYENLTTQRKLQKTSEVRIKQLENELNKNREMFNEHVRRYSGEIQNITAWKTSVQNDSNVINRY